MGAILFAAFVGVSILEIVLFVEIGGRIGLGPTIGVIVLTAFAGTTLLRHQGLAVLRRAQASLTENRFPMDEVFDGLCLVVAGALLLTPGFFTDAFGLLLFVPPFRLFLRQRLGAVLIARGRMDIHTPGFEPGFGGDNPSVIDGEFEDITPEHDGKTGVGGQKPPDKNPRTIEPGK